METLTFILINLAICGALGAFLWLASQLMEARDEVERQNKALAIAFRQMGQPGLYQICDNSVKAMNDELNGGKSGE